MRARQVAYLLLLSLIVALVAARWVAPAPLETGTVARYYANDSWSGPPIIETVEREISTETLWSHAELNQLSQFTVEWTGVLVTYQPNVLRFATKSDDGSRLWIDERLVVDNGGLHAPHNVVGEVFLDRGVHSFRVRYLEAGGGRLLILGQWGSRGRITHPGPLLPRSITYRELRIRQLWPLALVALTYFTLLCIAALGILRLSDSPYLPPVATICRDKWFVAAAAIGLGMALWHIDYGVWVHGEFSGDELMPLDTLGASASLFREWNLRWPSGYPAFITLMLQPFVWAHDLFDLPLVDATVAPLMLLVIRLVSVGLLFLTLAMTFDIARQFGDSVAGAFAVALLALSPTVVYFGPFANLETPHLFLMTASWWTWLNFVRRRDLIASALFAASVGLSLAVKDQAYGYYLAAPIAVLLVLRRVHDRRVYLIAAATLAAFAIGQGIPWAWDRFADHIRFITSNSISKFQMFPHSAVGHLQLGRAVAVTLAWAAGVPLMLVFLGACVWESYSRHGRRLASFTVPLATYVVGFLGVVMYVYDRFFIGWLPVAAVLGGLFLRSMLLHAAVPRIVPRAIAALVIGVSLVNAIGQNRAFHADARYAAAAWITRDIPCGSSVGVTMDAQYVPPLGCYEVWPFAPWQMDQVARWPEYFVLSETYAQRFAAIPSGARFLERLRSGHTRYRLAFRSEAAPPRWVPLFWETRFRNRREDPETTLDKPLDAIQVWRLRTD
jgi:PA14 domain/Dolichyl-phosphate-mannose-protein mannosyltransferase